MKKIYPVLVVVLLVALIYEVQQRRYLENVPARVGRPVSSAAERTPAAPLDRAELFRRIDALVAENRRLRRSSEGAPTPSGALAKTDALRDILARLPDQRIPELRLATEVDWITAADQDLDSAEGVRKALATLRAAAEKRFAAKLRTSLSEYLRASKGAFPREVSDLAPFFHEPLADVVARYRVVPASDYPNIRVGGDWAITQVSLVDSSYDTRLVVGPNGFGAFGER
ncbi:MAG TPA: hypothetical protein VG710_01930 [Opitutus sp.]|nr:hypothetical protein [Opitutus sp.]